MAKIIRDDVQESTKAVQAGLTNSSVETVLLNTNDIAMANIINSMDAPTLTVSYYSQYVGSNEEVYSLDPSREPVYQSYQKIEEMEVRVTSPVVPATDPESGKLRLESTLLIYPCLVPNTYDPIVFTLPDGRKGLFEVTNVTRKTASGDSLHEVTIVSIIIGDDDLYRNLESKVTKVSKFLKYRLLSGQQSIISSEEYGHILTLRSQINDMKKHYWQCFYNHQHKTLIYDTGIGGLLYDHLLVKHLQLLGYPSNFPELRSFPIDDMEVFRRLGFWDALVSMDDASLSFGYQQVKWVYQKSIPTMGIIPSLLGYNNVRMALPFVASDDYLGTNNTDIPFQSPSEINGGPFEDNYYVASAALYEKDVESYNGMEILISSHLKREHLDRDVLKSTIETIYEKPIAHKFYYIPVLITLAMMELRK